MKRWFPIVFLGLTLLAKSVGHGIIAQRDATLPLSQAAHIPQPLEAFAFLSGPTSLCLLWVFWKPTATGKAALGKIRRRAGALALVATIIGWLFFLEQWLQAAWVASTPTKYLQYWIETSYRMYRYADICLIVGGLLSLWLKGIRIPPRGDGEK